MTAIIDAAEPTTTSTPSLVETFDAALKDAKLALMEAKSEALASKAQEFYDAFVLARDFIAKGGRPMVSGNDPHCLEAKTENVEGLKIAISGVYGFTIGGHVEKHPKTVEALKKMQPLADIIYRNCIFT